MSGSSQAEQYFQATSAIPSTLDGEDVDASTVTGPIAAVTDTIPARRRRHAHGTWRPEPVPGGRVHARTEPLPRVPPEPEFAASRGVLPLPDDPGDEPVVRRTRVTLNAPPRPSARDDAATERALGYSAPVCGLDKFDLGSVPASVTPPRTWRTAAWFAALASGAAVVAMLLVGTTLVGGPTEDTHALQSWPDGGRAPELPVNALHGSTVESRASTGADEDDAEAERSDQEGASGSAASAQATPPPRDNRADQDDGEDSATATDDSGRPVAVPSKPPASPARTSAAPIALWAPHDTDVMVRRSQEYFNTVTEDPQAAHALTTGELAAEGPEGLEARYADVAYFEVRHVYVDANKGHTVNTIEVTYVDGTTGEQTRRLTFASDDRIESDTP